MKSLYATILLLTMASATHAADWVTLVPPTSASVPRLEIKRGDAKGTCSAVVVRVEDGWAYALTAAHSVERAPADTFDLTANDRHAITVESNALLDLAVIKFRARKETAILVAPAAPAPGAEVAVIGYAFGIAEPAAQFGHVAQVYNRETKSMWIDAMIIFGDSGGAIVDDHGRLVGITSRIYSGGLLGQSAHMSAAVPWATVKDFLEHVEGGRVTR